MLFLGDLSELSLQEVKDHIKADYSGVRDGGGEEVVVDLEGCEIIIAYESVGSWGCDSSSFFLFRKDDKLYEVNGSHCSCYGFEGQWTPEETTLVALFHRANCGNLFYAGGYDDDSEKNQRKAVDTINRLYAAVEMEKIVLNPKH